MRRKSERNKGKGATEKKVEKPTPRRTTRRRGRGASPAGSPERETTEDNVSSTPFSDEEQEQEPQKYQPEEQAVDKEEGEKAITSSELIKSVLGGGEEDDNGSVWKVARADASPGEIQKLKLCRQRNISEASDSSSSKKKSNKWPDSGEGDAEEADSADEQVASSHQTLTCEQADDPSSAHPGQDSNEEVSDHTENLPETTSANLSDDNTNIDQQADLKENLQPETTTTNLSEPTNYEDNQSSDPSTDLPGDNSRDALQLPDSQDQIAEPTDEGVSSNKNDENNQPETSIESTSASHLQADSDTKDAREYLNTAIPTEENVQIQEKSSEESVASHDNEAERSPESDLAPKEDSSLKEEIFVGAIPINNEMKNVGNEEFPKDIKKANEEEDEEEEGELREGPGKEPSPESDDVKDESDSDKSSVRKNKHKNHSKYHESSSESPTSDDEKIVKKKGKSKNKKTVSSSVKGAKKIENNISFLDENSISVLDPEIDLSESNMEKDDVLEINEKSDDLNVTSVSVTKSAKVSLKRSFSARLSTDTETKKEEEVKLKKTTSDDVIQNKENHVDNEQPTDQKSSTKRRRWGVTTTSDVAPAFSISTDSLKALVPGAKPLSANEVKLTKDEDDEKEYGKSKNDVSGGHKSKNDSPKKNDLHKKTEEKIDNHIAPRRKISIVKETPRPSSPSLPEAQATNILLIKNLVRPFTLNQIKELLSRTGTITENGFWMDRIKSKCFVEYANEDQAFETRQALHGVSWPPSNPKKLIVEYSTKADMEVARDSTKEQPVARKAEPLVSADVWQQDQWLREDRNTVVNKLTVIREWDLGKEDGHMSIKEKERERKELEKKKRQRSRSPVLEAHLPPPARKFKKKEEEPPTAKLLDDLFRKTKSTPCIYWLPLTNEQILVKEEMRRQHMAEHARRLEEMRRAERSRDSRRRRSPRK